MKNVSQHVISITFTQYSKTLKICDDLEFLEINVCYLILLLKSVFYRVILFATPSKSLNDDSINSLTQAVVYSDFFLSFPLRRFNCIVRIH